MFSMFLAFRDFLCFSRMGVFFDVVVGFASLVERIIREDTSGTRLVSDPIRDAKLKGRRVRTLNESREKKRVILDSCLGTQVGLTKTGEIGLRKPNKRARVLVGKHVVGSRF